MLRHILILDDIIMTEVYNPAIVEQEAQAYWVENQSFAAKEDLSREKFYCLSMLPYPSGELHMGHVRNYTIGDVIARYQRMRGKNVLQPMGWDAFGLPAENAALKHKTAPATWTYQNIAQMRQQLQQLGFGIDWRREFATCKPEYYRWEQWLFVRMFKKGLAYKKKAVVNWDPVDQTVLANEQVINGRGWRSNALIERREISQWFLKITDYADELLAGLDELTGWPEQVRTMQRNWIGRSTGVEVDFAVASSDSKLTIFTTRADTLLGVTYLAIAPEHPLAIAASAQNPKIAAFIEKYRHTKVAEAEMATLQKEGIATPFHAIHPITGEHLPIWIANYVLMDYGSGAVMAVPAHDVRDFEFAQQYQLPMKIVLEPEDGSVWNYHQGAMINAGKLIDSGEFNGLASSEAIEAIADYLVQNQKGQRKTHYRLRDWGISRQRYWGAPIPIINCAKCGAIPVPEQHLPVILPEDVTLDKPGSPLASMPSFYNTTCPSCGQAATRETDTFDTFMESSWYYARYCSFDQHNAMLDDRAKYWTPVDQYIGGIEHAVMHLLYARFIHKVMRDEGLVNCNEPFANLLTQGMVLKDGAKMSKSKGNTVAPTELIAKYGADTARLFSIFAAPPELSLEWSDSGVEGAHRFLKRLWAYAQFIKPMMHQFHREEEFEEHIDMAQLTPAQQLLRSQIHEILQQANFDMERMQFNTVVSAAMKIFNLLPASNDIIPEDARLLHESMSILLRLLAPITPHITHHLWLQLELGEDILDAPWPKTDKRALTTATIELVVQVNGKLRSRVNVPRDADETVLENVVLADDNVKRAMLGKSCKKLIIVPNKLINIVV